MNTYSYAMQNPVIFYDPDGGKPVTATVMGIACVIGAGATVVGNIIADTKPTIPSLTLGCATGALSLVGAGPGALAAMARYTARWFGRRRGCRRW